jgi:hypothetical protein
MPTFSFKNKGGYWSTRYTYNAFNFSKINRDLISVPVSNQDSLWLHGPKSKTGAEKTQYYGASPAGSGLKFTFNQNVSANKIYKNMSLEGSIGASNITSASLTINDSTDPSQLRPTNLQGWEEKGAHLHANIGKNDTMTRSTITPVGRIKSMYQLFFSENQNLVPINSFENQLAEQGGVWGWGSFQGFAVFGQEVFGAEGKKLPDVLNNSDDVSTLQAAGQDYLANLFNIERAPGWDNPTLSPYMFIEVEFFGNYRGSSQKTKYLIKTGEAEGYIGVDNPYDYSFEELPVFLDGYNRGMLNSPNRVTFDATPQSWNEPSESSPGGYRTFEFPGVKKNVRQGILCSIDTAATLNICDIEWPTVAPGGNQSACDWDFSGDIGNNDLLGILGVLGTSKQPNPDIYNLEFDFDPSPAFWDEILGELLLNFGAAIGSIGNPSTYANQLNNAITNEGVVFTLYAATPGEVDGEYARGNYMDMTLNLKGNFELDVVNLDYEPTTLDHSR